MTKCSPHLNILTMRLTTGAMKIKVIMAVNHHYSNLRPLTMDSTKVMKSYTCHFRARLACHYLKICASWYALFARL